jgi:hypothetical protein
MKESASSINLASPGTAWKMKSPIKETAAGAKPLGDRRGPGVGGLSANLRGLLNY